MIGCDYNQDSPRDPNKRCLEWYVGVDIVQL